MICNSVRNSCFVHFLFCIFVLASCQKEIDPNAPDLIPDEVKDSTLLIKSIKLVTLDPLSGLAYDDSIKEDYFYDTVNKKIILTIDHAASHADYFSFVGIEHQYDGNGLLTNITHKYKDGFMLDDNILVSVKLDYDADKILRKIVASHFNGDIKTILFNKTLLLADKYQLEWDEPLFRGFGEDTANVRAIFDKEGKCLMSEYSYPYQRVVGGGSDTYTQIIQKDTLIYDAAGNVSKIVVNRIDTASHEEESFVGCEFLSRHTRGDQLFNQQQVLLNGIANIPFGEDLFRGSISGILSYFPNGYESKQYNKYPFREVKIYDRDTKQYKDFTGVSEFDSKDRLVKFTGFLNESELFPYVYEVKYYK